MNLRRAIGIIVVAGLLMAPTLAQDQYALRMKYAPGEQWISNITFTGVGTIGLDYPGGPAEPGDLWINGGLSISEATKSVDDRGVADVEWKLVSLDAEYQFPGMQQAVMFEDGQFIVTVHDQVIFDSLDPEQAKRNPMLALLGQGVIVKQDATGKVVAAPQLELLLKMMMPDSDLKGALEQSTGPMPPGPVKIGDTWEERQVWPYGLPEGAERPVSLTRHRFEALELVGGHQCAKIAFTGSFDLNNMKTDLPAFMGPLLGGTEPAGVAINTMAVEMTGTHYFDIERGTTLKADASITLNQDMTLRLLIPMREGEQEQQGEGDAAEEPEAPQMREINVGVTIEDLVIDVAIEVAQ